MAQLNFDARSVAPQDVVEAIPAGWYNVQITASEMKPTSGGNGAYLQLEMTILDGEFAKRKLFDRINLQNPNPVAVEIGYRQLSAICHATGVIQVQDSQQLHGIPLKVKVSLRAAGPGADGKHYDASNEIKGYKNINDGASAAPTMAAPAPAYQPPVQQPQYQQPMNYGQAPQYQQPPAGFAQAPAPAPMYAPAAEAMPQQPMAAAAPAAMQQPAPAAPAGNGAPTPPWMQQQPQQAPMQQQAPAPQPTPAAGPTPPWAQARQ